MPIPDAVIKEPVEPDSKELARFKKVMALDNQILAVNLKIISKELSPDDGEFELTCLWNEIEKLDGTLK